MVVNEAGLLDLEAPQRKLLNTLLNGSGDVRLTATIPDDAPAEKVLEELGLCCGALVKIESMGDALKPVIGRLLFIIQTRGMFRPDYGTFEEFLDDRVVKGMGMSRSSLFEAKRMIKSFPNLTITEYREIGATNLVIASRVTSQEDTGYKKILEAAKGHTVEGFKKWLTDKGLVEAGDLTGEMVSFRTTKKIAKLWNQWIVSEEVQAWADSKDPGKILEAMMQECSTEVDRAGKK